MRVKLTVCSDSARCAGHDSFVNNSLTHAKALLTTLATFLLFDTEIRRCVADKHDLLPYVSVSLTCRYTGVRYAACQVVRMLSRAVGVLRTSITDSGLGIAVFELFKKGMDGGIAKHKDRGVEGEDVRVVDAALKAICNLVVEFSPLASVSHSRPA